MKQLRAYHLESDALKLLKCFLPDISWSVFYV